MNILTPVYILLANLFFVVLYSCKNKDIQKNEKEVCSACNVIELSDAASQEQTVKLSEIADSITFLPLSNIKDIGEEKIIISDRYIYAGSKVFDWNGSYLFEVGTRGTGPGEEPFLHTIISIDSLFYSMADKLIKYDSRGKYMGKECSVLDIHPLGMGRAGNNIAFCTLDTLYFYSSDLFLKKVVRVVPDWPEKSEMMSYHKSLKFFTENMDSVLYYNYVNDTIYRVLNDDIQPRWVISLGNDKIPTKHILGNESKRMGVGAKYFSNENLSDWDYLKETDNKIRVFSVFESENYVFAYWFRMREFWQLRNMSPSVFQIAYYDKKLNTTKAVSGDGFIDDISSLGTFYPLLGIHDNCMVNSFWPYELKEKVDLLRQNGDTVDAKLLNLVDKVKDEDNPILVLVHLK